MSDDLIRRSDAIKALRKRWARTINYDGIGEDIGEECEEAINSIPVTDRPQGEWKQNVFRSDIYRYECSNCKAHHRARYDYCPSCGARMKGADDEHILR